MDFTGFLAPHQMARDRGRALSPETVYLGTRNSLTTNFSVAAAENTEGWGISTLYHLW